MNLPEFVFSDGGRKAAGRKGTTGDCGTRAIAHVTECDYLSIYKRLFLIAKEFEPIRNTAKARRIAKRIREKASPSDGLWYEVLEVIMNEMGWSETKLSNINTARIPKEFLAGKHLLKMRHHYAALIEGKYYDAWDSRLTSGRFTDGKKMPASIYRVWSKA